MARWFRHGRGHGLEFFATDEEVQGWLNTDLLPRFSPYHIVGADMVKETRRKYHEVPFECEVPRFLDCMRGADRRRWQFFIKSDLIRPTISEDEADRPTSAYSLGGMIQLQHGLRLRDGFLQPSAIGIVDRIDNLDTGEFRENRDYIKVFEKLRRAIRRSLTYTSVLKTPDGRIIEDNQCKMTDAIVEAWKKGFPLSRAPGNRRK